MLLGTVMLFGRLGTLGMVILVGIAGTPGKAIPGLRGLLELSVELFVGVAFVKAVGVATAEVVEVVFVFSVWLLVGVPLVVPGIFGTGMTGRPGTLMLLGMVILLGIEGIVTLVGIAGTPGKAIPGPEGVTALFVELLVGCAVLVELSGGPVKAVGVAIADVVDEVLLAG